MPRNPDRHSLIAPAKLNLYLHVTGRRGSYHLIESLAVFTQFGDRLEVSEGADISLQVEGPFAAECGPLENNLVLRAAQALAALAPQPVGAMLKLQKFLPAASGMGGGSSDAAAALRLLIPFWKLHIDDITLDNLALRLGADVPVCLRRRPTLVSGIGDALRDAPQLPPCYVLLVNPRIPLATQAVFERLDGQFGMAARPLPPRIANVKKLARILNVHRNDLQNPAMALAPEIGIVLELLSKLHGCLLARMSGSGATCFALFAQADEMGAAAQAVTAHHPEYWIAQTRF
ncbi:MAG TPA: 4-(cytidine 5'-diphospho)-2-C-methyl-D-erythritol kinase [Alphaproteobacteria bacterium]|nr:4-(cytidine 5'-diphospho)-2-C-methyl-D-erythritol kinase [Alphaproteobacteria bacterium]